MADATLERGGTSVNIPLIEQGGTPIVSTDFGKPNIETYKTGDPNPRISDQWSGNENISLLGRFAGSSAYSNARTLAELIKEFSGGTDLVLNLPLSEFDSDMTVCPAAEQEEAVSLTFPPGDKDRVDVDLGLTRVHKTIADGSQSINIPTAAGTGPIQIQRGSSTVDLDLDVEVTWSLGRPNSIVKRQSNRDFPRYIDKRKAAYEAFEIRAQHTQNAVSTVNTLIEDIFRPKLGRDSLTLDFQGVFGLGAFDVAPLGGAPIRTVRQAGEQGVIVTPTLQFRRVLDD